MTSPEKKKKFTIQLIIMGSLAGLFARLFIDYNQMFYDYPFTLLGAFVVLAYSLPAITDKFFNKTQKANQASL